jgi:hypothetical protein
VISQRSASVVLREARLAPFQGAVDDALGERALAVAQHLAHQRGDQR